MRLALLGLALVRSSAAQSSMPDEPEANPGRPTVSTPATLTPVGYLQFESGFLGANHSPEFSSRYGLNEVTKLSITPRLEMIASTEPYVRYSPDRRNLEAAWHRAYTALGALPRPSDRSVSTRE